MLKDSLKEDLFIYLLKVIPSKTKPQLSRVHNVSSFIHYVTLIYVTRCSLIRNLAKSIVLERFLNFWYKAQYFNCSLRSNLLLGGPCRTFCKDCLLKGSVGRRKFSSREESRLAKNEFLEIYFKHFHSIFWYVLYNLLERKPKIT